MFSILELSRIENNNNLQVEELGLDNDFLSALHLNSVLDADKKYDMPADSIKSRNVSFLDKWNEFYMRSDIPEKLKDIENLTKYLAHNCRETFSMLLAQAFIRIVYKTNIFFRCLYSYFTKNFDCCEEAKPVMTPDFGLCWAIRPPSYIEVIILLFWLNQIKLFNKCTFIIL